MFCCSSTGEHPRCRAKTSNARDSMHTRLKQGVYQLKELTLALDADARQIG